MGGRPRARRPDTPRTGGSAEDGRRNRAPHRTLFARGARSARAARAVERGATRGLIRAAAEAGRLPRASAFRRARRGRVVEGWTLDGDQRVRYEVPVATLFAMAHVPRGATALTDGPLLPATASADVPDIEALSLWMPV